MYAPPAFMQVTSQGCTYIVRVDARRDGRVEVEVSQNSPAARWSGSFTATCES